MFNVTEYGKSVVLTASVIRQSDEASTLKLEKLATIRG